jgi:hypothetical protein
MDHQNEPLYQELEQKIKLATGKVVGSLPGLESITQDEAKRIIGRYSLAFAEKFVYWLTVAKSEMVSDEARGIIESNIGDEVYGDHTNMLLDFAGSLGAKTTGKDYDDFNLYNSEMLEMISKRGNRDESRGLRVVTHIAMVESVLSQTMGYLEGIAGKLTEDTHLTYTQVHSENDPHHTTMFLNVIYLEMKQKGISTFEMIDEAIAHSVNYFKGIYLPASTQ